MSIQDADHARTYADPSAPHLDAEGLLGTRINEKRNLTILPGWAYGNKAVGGNLIPANSTLYFECQVMKINGKGEDDYPSQ